MALTALADPTRRAILEQLRDGPRSVAEIARGLPVSRPAVSQHLRVLKDASLARESPQGTRRIYSINPDGLAKLRAYLDTFWTDVLGAYQTATEQPRKKGGKK